MGISSISKIQAKHIPEDVLIGNIRMLQDQFTMAYNVGGKLEFYQIQDVSRHDLESLWPTVPRKVILAKLRRLIRAGKIEGCACGCCGGFRVIEPPAEKRPNSNTVVEQWYDPQTMGFKRQTIITEDYTFTEMVRENSMGAGFWSAMDYAKADADLAMNVFPVDQPHLNTVKFEKQRVSERWPNVGFAQEPLPVFQEKTFDQIIFGTDTTKPKEEEGYNPVFDLFEDKSYVTPDTIRARFQKFLRGEM